MILNEYEVSVTCEGESLPEYAIAPEGGDGRTLVCFIPSESGKTFAIQCNNKGHDTISIRFKVDGHILGHSMLCLPFESSSKATVRTGHDVAQPLQFSDLKTTDDDRSLRDMSKQADVGTIEVSLLRVSKEGRKVPAAVESFQLVDAVHERSKKAGAHSIGLGTKLSVEPLAHLLVFDPIDPREGYSATFIFRYRPRDLLQAQEIIPRDPPKPEAGPSGVKKRRAGSLDRFDVKRVARASAQTDLGVLDVSEDEEDKEILLARNLLKQAQEMYDNLVSQRRPGRVKREPKHSASVPLDDVVIDLTLDD